MTEAETPHGASAGKAGTDEAVRNTHRKNTMTHTITVQTVTRSTSIGDGADADVLVDGESWGATLARPEDSRSRLAWAAWGTPSHWIQDGGPELADEDDTRRLLDAIEAEVSAAAVAAGLD